jgi:hypothetical protein
MGAAKTVCKGDSMKRCRALRVPPPRTAVSTSAAIVQGPFPFYTKAGRRNGTCLLTESQQLPAVRYDVRVGDRVVPVVQPARVKTQRRADQAKRVAQGLVRLPAEALALIEQVVIYDTANPSDTCWSELKHIRITAGMTAGSDGVVSVFPHAFKDRSDATLYRNLFHEVGHTATFQRWGSVQSSGWNAYRDAVARDVHVVSRYGDGRNGERLDEDAAEATALYLLTRGDPKAHQKWRAFLPARFAVLDTLWAQR